MARQMREPKPGLRRGAEAEQGRAALHLEPGAGEHLVEPLRVLLQAGAGGLRPVAVGIGFGAGGEGLGGDGPVAEGGAHLRDDVRAGDDEAEPHAGQAVKFAEGAQHDQPVMRMRRDAEMRRDIAEGFIHDQQPGLRQAAQLIGGDGPAVRVVGIDDDEGAGVGQRVESK